MNATSSKMTTIKKRTTHLGQERDEHENGKAQYKAGEPRHGY
jgi:hypothetical protein